jgi:hypothetical protein
LDLGLNKTIETVPRGRIDDESVRAVVLDRASEVTPINGSQPIRVLLKHKIRRSGWPGNSHRVRSRQALNEGGGGMMNRYALPAFVALKPKAGAPIKKRSLPTALTAPPKLPPKVARFKISVKALTTE